MFDEVDRNIDWKEAGVIYREDMDFAEALDDRPTFKD